MTRSRSRWNTGRMGSSASGRNRPRLCRLLAAWGARYSISRASRSSRMDMGTIVGGGRQPQLGQETSTVRQRLDAEQIGERLAEIREAVASAEIHAWRHGIADDQERHVLARVIGRRRGRI